MKVNGTGGGAVRDMISGDDRSHKALEGIKRNN